MRLLLALFACMTAATIASAAEQIEIANGDVRLKAILYRPAGPGPFPAVVALHGCNGLFDGAGHERPQYQDWGQRLVESGFAVLFPDSFAPRGLGPQCMVQRRRVRPDRERMADANAAREWFQSQDWVLRERVSLLGWSQGGVAALWAVRPRVTAARVASSNGRPDFRSAVAFYPGCRRLNDTAWSARIPTLILIGAADDWARAHDCEQMVGQARGRSAMATLVKYRGAYHYFDRANLPLQELAGRAFSADGSGRVHVGTHHEARADAIRRVPEWLAR